MKSIPARVLLSVLAIMLVASAVLVGPAANPARPVQAATDGRYIVVLKQGSGNDPFTFLLGLIQQWAIQPTHVYSAAIEGFAVELSAQEALILSQNALVDFVAPDGVASIAEQTLPTGIDRVDADLNPASDIDGIDNRIDVGVAVLDTGIQPDHPDLNVVGGVNFVGTEPANGSPNNCASGNLSNFADNHGHGTHVAGTIGALDNDSGVVGVAPGTPLYGVKILDAGGNGKWSEIICGIDWVTARSDTIKVANLSLGAGGSDDGNCGHTNDDPVHTAICNAVAAGVTFVVAAGNSNINAAGFIPAAYDEVITVSALADLDGRPGGDDPDTYRVANVHQDQS